MDNERDIFNEKPSKEEIIAATQVNRKILVKINDTVVHQGYTKYIKKCPKIHLIFRGRLSFIWIPHDLLLPFAYLVIFHIFQ